MLLVHTKESNQSQSSDDNVNNELHEVLFIMSSNITLDLEFNDVNQKALHYLTHRITRDPDDLRSHVQRIQLSLQLQNSDVIFGALLDLYIALTDKGIAIRRRMLSLSRPYLSVLQRVFLSHSLDSGLSATDVLPPSSGSALSLGYSGTETIKAREESAQIREIDPVQLAQDYIEYGQIDDARDVLEIAVVAQPWRKELHTELLGVYRATHDSVRSQKMYSTLGNSSIPDDTAWQDTLQFVRQFEENV